MTVESEENAGIGKSLFDSLTDMITVDMKAGVTAIDIPDNARNTNMENKNNQDNPGVVNTRGNLNETLHFKTE